MDETPKHIKRTLRELAGRAYEVELGRELTVLRSQFGQGERGDMNAFDLTEGIHRFHQGPARELYLRYVPGNSKIAVAHAIATGVIDRAQVAPDVLEHLAGAISLFQEV